MFDLSVEKKPLFLLGLILFIAVVLPFIIVPLLFQLPLIVFIVVVVLLFVLWATRMSKIFRRKEPEENEDQTSDSSG